MAPFRARLLIFASVLIFAALAAVPARAENYARIVSLYPGHTDNVVALGAGAKLVGISENDNEGLLPGVPRFSMKAGPEALLALRPDLVLTRTLADSQNPELKKVLERAGVRVEVIDPPTWEGFEQYLRKIAELAGTSPDAAVAELAKARAEIRAAAEKSSRGRRPLVFVEATSRELHTCIPARPTRGPRISWSLRAESTPRRRRSPCAAAARLRRGDLSACSKP